MSSGGFETGSCSWTGIWVCKVLLEFLVWGFQFRVWGKVSFFTGYQGFEYRVWFEVLSYGCRVHFVSSAAAVAVTVAVQASAAAVVVGVRTRRAGSEGRVLGVRCVYGRRRAHVPWRGLQGQPVPTVSQL